jgi:hypothetical protein
MACGKTRRSRGLLDFAGSRREVAEITTKGQRRRTGASALHEFWVSFELALVPVGVGWRGFAGGVQFRYLLGG